MFDVSLPGKTAVVTVRYNPTDVLFEAIVITGLGGEAKPETHRLQDTDMYLLFKQLRHITANDKLSALVMQRFIRSMGAEIRVLSVQRRTFLKSAKKDIGAIKAALKKARAARQAKEGKTEKKVVGKKTTKKVATKKVVEEDVTV